MIEGVRGLVAEHGSPLGLVDVDCDHCTWRLAARSETIGELIASDVAPSAFAGISTEEERP